MKTPSRVHVRTNDIAIAKQKEEYLITAQKIQRVITTYADIGIGQIESIADLNESVRNPKDFLNSRLKDRIGKGALQVGGGLSLKSKNLSETLDIPDPAAFYAAVQDLKKE